MKRTFLLFLFAAATLQPAWGADNADSGKATSRRPAIVLSQGALSFIGDVGFSQFNEPLLHHGGFQLSAQFAKGSRLSPQVYYMHGDIGANEKTVARTLNFHTDLNAFGILLNIHLVGQEEKRRIVVPFLCVGLEYLSFTPKGDLTDAEGVPYYYWSDGSIRNIDESAPNASSAQLIYRDYNYETNLRDANLDGVGNYSLGTVAIPAGIGVRMNLSGRCSFYLSSVVHFTFTDHLDNVSSAGTGARQGDSQNDKFVYTSAGFSYDLAAPRETEKKKKLKNKDFKHIDFNALAIEDGDKDGVNDLLDEAPDTPPNVAVDAQGKPLDTDADGVPDYRDKEMNSAPGVLVTEEGLTLTDAMIEEKFMQDSLKASVREYIRPIADDPYSQSKRIPEVYKKVDVDNSGVISSKEIGDAIDDFLNGRSTYDSEAFYRLIDFYFSQ